MKTQDIIEHVQEQFEKRKRLIYKIIKYNGISKEVTPAEFKKTLSILGVACWKIELLMNEIDTVDFQDDDIGGRWYKR